MLCAAADPPSHLPGVSALQATALGMLIARLIILILIQTRAANISRRLCEVAHLRKAAAFQARVGWGVQRRRSALARDIPAPITTSGEVLLWNLLASNPLPAIAGGLNRQGRLVRCCAFTINKRVARACAVFNVCCAICHGRHRVRCLTAPRLETQDAFAQGRHELNECVFLAEVRRGPTWVAEAQRPKPGRHRLHDAFL
mmetsp:Transcript_79609/g.200234  ORF Transcript_79609/g.200234 Transcript_79609/m.200234 type:complete len:200 (-) Transcript_79609:55-654(-)